MPAPRVFVSSTAYDLGLLRGQLRSFVIALGFDPVLSEYSDVLYDPRTHTQSSCVKEIPGCDLLVLVVGSRFGSEAIPAAIHEVDLAKLEARGDIELITDHARLSVTQLELLKAIEQRIPVFAFVDDRVLQDDATYEANQNSPFIDQIRFASISQPQSAKYIFAFIDFLRSRVANNAIIPFSKIEDIESHLRKQWASLFQRLLQEERGEAVEQQRIDRLAEQFEDLKAAILTTIGDAPSRDVARGVVNNRLLVDALRGLLIPDLRRLIEEGTTWGALMHAAGISWPEGIEMLPEDRALERVLIHRQTGPALRGRLSAHRIMRLPEEWEQFRALPVNARLAIYDALGDVRMAGPSMFVPVRPQDQDQDSEPPLPTLRKGLDAARESATSSSSPMKEPDPGAPSS